jgi:D-amino-acid dehydrogenase
MSSNGRKETAIVVGSGIVGIACAHYLAEAGLKVSVIDKGTIAGACSYGNCGYICPSHVSPLTEPGAIGTAIKSLFNPRAPFRVKPSLSPALWNWMWQFARRCNHAQVLAAGKHLQSILDASMNEYRRLIPKHSLDCEWKHNGLLYVFQTERGMQRFAETDEMLLENFGVAARRIEGDALQEFEPGLKPGLAGAFHYLNDASVRPDLLCKTWADRLRDGGITMIENCELRGVRKSASRVAAIETSTGGMEADLVVFALGAWSARWSSALECNVPIQPGKGYSITMSRPEYSPRHPILFPEHKVGASPFKDGFRLGSMMEFTGYDKSIPSHRIQLLRDSARPYLKASVDGEAQETWFGWRPMTWDSLPIIGRAPRLANAFLATGHNMLGLSLAPATGRLIAELVTGEKTHIDAAPFSPLRFQAGPAASN